MDKKDNKNLIMSDTVKLQQEKEYFMNLLQGEGSVLNVSVQELTEHIMSLQFLAQKREVEEEINIKKAIRNRKTSQIEEELKTIMNDVSGIDKTDDMPDDLRKTAEKGLYKKEPPKPAKIPKQAVKPQPGKIYGMYGEILNGRSGYTKKEKEKTHVRIIGRPSIEEAERRRMLRERTLPAGWKNSFANNEKIEKEHVDTSAEALLLSLANLGRVDMEYISTITGKQIDECLDDLKGSIYQNPEKWNETFYLGWETADEYLSGNIAHKIQYALAANEKYNGYFDENIKALKKQISYLPDADEIYVSLGSPWLPTDVVDSFITHLLGSNAMSKTIAGRVKHDTLTGSWEIPEKNRYFGNALSYTKYGTYRMEALQIIERTLNMRPIVVKDEERDYTSKSGVKYFINRPETLLALEKQEVINNEFRQWIWSDQKRKDRLKTLYREKYGCIKKRTYSGKFLKFHGMNPDVEIFDYQKDAIARILLSKNTLLAHDVGSGKTYIMVAAAMELKKMGLSKKNMIVVPNNIVGQWKNIFLMLYPEAKVLAIEPKAFTLPKRKAVLEKIRDRDYDAVIIAYSCFDLIPMSRDWYFYKLEDEHRKIKDNLQKGHGTQGIRTLSKKNSREFALLLDKEEDKKDILYFDELGITRLFVDEAHNYKNVPLDTKIENIRGIKSAGSAKCALMMDKVHFTQLQNNGGGVVMATGTPITNSLTDAYIMQKYLQPGDLEELDLQSFDSWIGMFAEKATDFEIDVDTSNYRMSTRFARFHNLPELTAMLSGISDFHVMNKSEDLPEFNGYNDIVISKTNALSYYLAEISQRADDIRQGKVRRENDNMLKLTTDGRKAALDVRLVMENESFKEELKVAKCATLVAEIYKKTQEISGTQLVFCDISVPKETFNIYDEMKRLLAEKGIPEKEIAYIYDADTDAEREELFGKMREGKIRVLLGSTLKLGLGVNVQDKLYALHHLDVPWRPADMVQREGRIIRQGNTNKEVFIYRYITSGSFDAYSWQLLETKQQFITALLSGSMKQRSGSDIEDTVLNYAEVKALAVGNPLVKKRVKLSNELSRLVNLQKKTADVSISLEHELEALPKEIKAQKELLGNCKKDMECYRENYKDYSADERKSLRNYIFTQVSENEFAESERKIATYQGFDIILPTNMIKEKAFVWVRKFGSYSVEMGDADRGALVRIDNLLEDLDDRRKRLQKKVDSLTLRKKKITEELENRKDYSSEIDAIQKELAEVDNKLGIEKGKK